MPRTLDREPPRGGQTCGYQITVTTWTSRASYCGEPKLRGLYWCQEHHDWVIQDEPDGVMRMAPGNAVGTGRRR